MARMKELTGSFFIVGLTCAFMTLTGRAAQTPVPTAEQIVEKNVAARGGLKAWHEIQTMTMTGKMDAGSKANVQLPFVVKLKRPRMSRLEIQFAGKTALQVFDGENGWKVRPFMGRNEVEPYTGPEKELALEQADLDGLLIDHERKGIKVDLVGEEPIEGHDAYKLKLTMKDGSARHLWLDAQSYLEVKIEGSPRRLDGTMHAVEIYYRNYSSVGGLMVPFVLETAVENVRPTHKVNIEAVTFNPPLADITFAKPDLPNATSPVAVSQGMKGN
jgi:outer membrane lipoprotein-sorting protein